MEVLNGTSFSSLVENNKRLFQGLLPELVKRLILTSDENVNHIRIPGNEDIWAPGFDGVVETMQSTPYVCSGLSVWEFGTNSNSLKKVNDDFNKRTEKTLGICQRDTEFYFVVPYIWAYDNQGFSITKWESDHKSVWKNVHIIDATVLAGWINSEPAVCAWLLEQVESETEINFASVKSAWERFSAKTSPALSHSLFLAGREKEATQLREIWGAPIIKVKADTTIDAFGFCLSVIDLDSEKANKVIVIDNQTTYKTLARFCKGKIFLMGFHLDCDVISGNQVVLCYNKEDHTVQPDIELRQLTKSLFDKAIGDMNIPNGQTMDLYGKTHGNLLSLIRKIPGNTTSGSPKWAKQDRIDLLAPILLLRDYDSQSECEQQLISYLAGESYDVISEKYHTWLRLEDAPIKCVENHLILINFEEAWDVLRLNPNSAIYNRLIKVIAAIISEPSSKDEIQKLVDPHTKRHLFNLLLDLVYFSNVEDNGDISEKSVKNIIKSTPFSPLILDHLSILAEAAPSVIMSFLIEDIKKECGVVYTCFSEKGYSNDYCKILFALEELVLHEETRVQACDFLFGLCIKTRDRHFSISNSPRESLLNALCLWNDRTIFTIYEKEALLDKYLSIDESFTTSFIAELLLKNSICFGVREGAKTFPKMIIYIDELSKAVNNLVEIVFRNCLKNGNIDTLEMLLTAYDRFNPNTLISSSKLFNPSSYTIDALIKMNSELRERLFFVGKNADEKPYLPALEAWIDATTPNDDIGKYGWLFVDYYHCYPSITPEIDDFDKQQKILEKKRQDTLKLLMKNHSTEELLLLVRCSNDDALWGAFFARYLSSEMLLAFAYEARRISKNRLLSGLIDRANREDCITLLNVLSTGEQNIVLQNMHRRDIFDWIDTPEKEQSYWMHQKMFEYDENMYTKFIEYNPYELLSYFAYIRKDSLCVDIEKITEVFMRIISINTEAPNRHISYEIDRIISRIDHEGYYTYDWAKLCADLYYHEMLQQYPNVLKRFYFENPVILCEQLIKPDGKAYSQFNFYYELPDAAYSESDAFDFFVKTIVDRHTDGDLLLSTLGSILGKAHNGSDDIFPHENVRKVLETYRELRLNHYVMIGKLNSRGVRTVVDGSFEKECAEKYQNDAKKFDIRYPETAQLLRWIGEDFAAEGKRDKLFSEIGISAW